MIDRPTDQQTKSHATNISVTYVNIRTETLQNESTKNKYKMQLQLLEES